MEGLASHWSGLLSPVFLSWHWSINHSGPFRDLRSNSIYLNNLDYKTSIFCFIVINKINHICDIMLFQYNC